jgi:adenine-specific DNA methylase
MKYHSIESHETFTTVRKHTTAYALSQDPTTLRKALLDLIADFANWENSTIKEYLDTCRILTAAAHYALSLPSEVQIKPFDWPGLGDWVSTIQDLQSAIEKDSRPWVVDPFSGGGAIPLEALRLGCDAYASDLNPVSVAINKVVLEHVPRYGETLLKSVLQGTDWILAQAERELRSYFLPDEDGATPIAYLWARTIVSEAPGGADDYPVEVPLIKTMWLAKKGENKRALRWLRDERGNVETVLEGVTYSDGSTKKVRRPLLEVFQPDNESEVEPGTVKKVSATCPVTNYTTPAQRVRAQLKVRKGGTNDARLYCVVTTRDGTVGRQYRLPNKLDYEQTNAAVAELAKRSSLKVIGLSLVPTEQTPLGGGRGAGRAFGQRAFGLETFADLFTPRQLLALSTYARLSRQYAEKLAQQDHQLSDAVGACFGLLIDRLADLNCSLCAWQLSTPNTAHAFVRWAIQVVTDFGEINPLAGAGGSPESALKRMVSCFEHLIASKLAPGQVAHCSADKHPLPNEFAQAFITDPPYYDAVPYADLLDFFYVWLKRSMPASSSIPTSAILTPKDEECIVDDQKHKDHAFFERTLKRCLAEGRRILQPSGIGVIVFAHKTTSGWESLLQAIVDANWIITGSWPIDTEMGSRLRARKSATLASSVHLVCRPRENPEGSIGSDEIGDWRDVLHELPRRIHAWIPRLADEGVVGADAIFACLGPALEIYSRYSRVEKSNGEAVQLNEYLEHVWGGVSKEALSMIFEGATTEGFEPDSRLTAMWLWTLATPAVRETSDEEDSEEEPDEDEEAASKKSTSDAGFSLEYDAARKIAQGLGAHLEDLEHVVEVKGATARLLSVAERTPYLFGKEDRAAPTTRKKKPKSSQLDLFKQLTDDEHDETWEEKTVSKVGETTLDRVHQSMLLFAANRSEALRRFLIEDGAAQDQRFWRLAQALSALYPKNCDEKRWVDGVLARKKGLGL